MDCAAYQVGRKGSLPPSTKVLQALGYRVQQNVIFAMCWRLAQ